MKELIEAIKLTGARLCLDCGKCTAVCPVARTNGSFSPRKTVANAVAGDEDALKDDTIWHCLTCRLCSERCPSDVDYVDLTRLARADAYKDGKEAQCSHGSAFQLLMRIMTAPELKQQRMGWVTPDLKIAEKSDWLYFVGCIPYFDAFFEKLNVNTSEIARSTVKLLNAVGIEPVVMPDERCCGHDLLWGGDIENFKMLARHNVEKIKATGATKIVSACPECVTTLKVYYPEFVGALPFEVMHLTELLDKHVASGALKFRKNSKRVTFQDPCRLGRFLNVYEQPRNLLKAICGDSFKDMRRSRNSSVCCGTSGWMNCGIHSKAIQTGRLTEARRTGSDLLATACAKCKIHFMCAMNDTGFPEESKIEVEDLAVLLASSLVK
ncbi:MAG: (Fe-S)-binding protein [Candidatus Eisenbacteria bacterium]|nr:(Fe-S)-binding protein [Candidatus Eisenbacteria bacterium]